MYRQHNVTVFTKGQLGKNRIFFELNFFDILIYFIEIYNPTKLQGLKLISFVITLIGQGQNWDNWATQHRALSNAYILTLPYHIQDAKY